MESTSLGWGQKVTIAYHVEHWLPGQLSEDGTTRDPPTPCEDILGVEEVCRFLKLDRNKDAKQSLQTIRDKGQLQGFKQSGRLMFLLKDVLAYIEQRKQDNPA